jgi:hypothetical protein
LQSFFAQDSCGDGFFWWRQLPSARTKVCKINQATVFRNTVVAIMPIGWKQSPCDTRQEFDMSLVV